MIPYSPFLERIFNHIDYLKGKNNCDIPLFRGHACKEWCLLPTLFRDIADKFENNNSKSKKQENIKKFEDILFYDFRSLGAPHIDAAYKSWDVLFLMRHYGLPTRLLDWTENFAVALFFALYDKRYPPNEKNNPCIWILDPFKLNDKSINSPEILEMEEFKDKCDYQEYLKLGAKNLEKFSTPVAIYPKRNVARAFSQKCAYTLHFEDMRPIEEIYRKNMFIKRFDIPQNEIENLKKFLLLSGNNEYSVYPDLQGLSDYLKRTIVDEY